MREDDYISDEQIDALYNDAGLVPAGRAPAPVPTLDAYPMAPPMAPAPIYPIPLAQVPTEEPIYARRVAGIPVWGWGIGALVLGGGAWLLINKPKGVQANPAPSAAPEPEGEPKSKWAPSRSRFGDVVKRHFQRRGIVDKVTIYTDADEAKKKLKQVSPLITIKVDTTYKVDKDLDKLCRREGLQPIAHGDGSIGLYPTESKRGREWEEYIDALRDDGQTV